MSRSRMFSGRLTALALVAAALVALSGGGALTSAGLANTTRASRLVRVGDVALLPSSSALAGALPAAQRVTFSVVLKGRDSAALAKLASAVSNPHSARYRDYLSVREFASRFGAASGSIASVSAYLRREGLSVGQVSANGWMLTVTGTAGVVEQALSVRLARVRLASGETAYTNLSAPLFPARIAAAISGVVGLSTVSHPEPEALTRASRSSSVARVRPSTFSARAASHAIHLSTGGPAPRSSCNFGLGNANSGTYQDGYSYDQIAAAYGFSSLYRQGDLGAGQTVALVEFEPTFSSDIAVFQRCYGTHAQVSMINVDGGPDFSSESDSEAALDTETIIGLAPRAKIDLYQAPQSASLAAVLNAIVSQDKAQVISNSWGDCEQSFKQGGMSEIGAENRMLEEAAVQGQSFYSAAGDAGAEDCSAGHGPKAAYDELAVDDPGSQPFATSVGGTTLVRAVNGTLTFDDNGSAAAELDWNDGPAWSEIGGGGGGGRSIFWSMPSYQSGASTSLGVIGAASSGSGFCGAIACRQVPDVSANANEDSAYLVYLTSAGESSIPVSSWTADGGTSAAAPLWAAFTALTNASSACGGKTVGFANPALYALAGSNYAGDFDDVQSTVAGLSSYHGVTMHTANNDTIYGWGYTVSSNTGSLYPVTAGYDMATGLGSMRAGALASGLCGLASFATRGRTAVRVSAASLGGGGRRKPVLKVTVAEGSVRAPITSLRLRLGAGFTIGSGAGALVRSITVSAGGRTYRFAATARGNVLTVTLALPSTGFTLTLRDPALRESAREARLIASRRTKQVGLYLTAFQSATAARNTIKTTIKV